MGGRINDSPTRAEDKEESTADQLPTECTAVLLYPVNSVFYFSFSNAVDLYRLALAPGQCELKRCRYINVYSTTSGGGIKNREMQKQKYNRSS